MGHLPEQELCDGGVEDEAALKDVGVEEADVGTRFGLAQLLREDEEREKRLRKFSRTAFSKMLTKVKSGNLKL